MTEIKKYLKMEHQECDALLIRSEKFISDKDWDLGLKEFKKFNIHMMTHLDKEEKVLFPAIEKKTGMTMGPTQVMRMEHQQMRDLLKKMDESFTTKDAHTFLGCSETLMILIQQHNLKEEQILYPMADQVLENQKEAIIDQMKKLVADLSLGHE